MVFGDRRTSPAPLLASRLRDESPAWPSRDATPRGCIGCDQPYGHRPGAKTRDTANVLRLHQDEIAATEAQLKKTEVAIECYMHAFESGSITEDMFGTRVRDLGNKVRTLRSHHAELSEAAEEADRNPPTAADIEALRQQLEAEIERGSDERRKAIAQAFVGDLVVDGRDTIQPIFYVRGELPPGISGTNSEPPSDEKRFRSMTPTVDIWWHQANPAAVEAPAIVLSRSNTVLCRGGGDR